MAWAVGPLGTGLHPLVRGAAQPGSGPQCHAMRLTYSSATTATTSTQRSSRKHTHSRLIATASHYFACMPIRIVGDAVVVHVVPAERDCGWESRVGQRASAACMLDSGLSSECADPLHFTPNSNRTWPGPVRHGPVFVDFLRTQLALAAGVEGCLLSSFWRALTFCCLPPEPLP